MQEGGGGGGPGGGNGDMVHGGGKLVMDLAVDLVVWIRWRWSWNWNPLVNGGSGVVVLRYQIAVQYQQQKATGGAISFYGGKTIHTFTNRNFCHHIRLVAGRC